MASSDTRKKNTPIPKKPAERKNFTPKPKSSVAVRTSKSPIDYPFFIITMVLLAFGIIMMFSASYAISYKEYGNSYHYVSRQIIFVIIGICAMLFASVVDYHIFNAKKIVWAIIIVSYVMLALVLTPVGVAKNGAQRWLGIGELTFQPSDIMKFAMIIFFAFLIQKNYDKMKTFKIGFLPFCIVIGSIGGLMMLEPHLSGTVIMVLIGVIMMFIGGTKLRYLLGLAGVGALGVAGIIAYYATKGIDYFGDRFLGFIDPFADISDKTYQTYQSLVTIGSGGFFGLGLGNSKQKFLYLPEAQNDFVFSIVCEELGFVGAITVIALFVFFVFRGFYIASRAKDKFGMMVAVGITLQIGLQALMNIAVVTNSMPNTGISLPFFSYGGTALVMQLAEMGVLLNISRQSSV